MTCWSAGMRVSTTPVAADVSPAPAPCRRRHTNRASPRGCAWCAHVFLTAEALGSAAACRTVGALHPAALLAQGVGRRRAVGEALPAFPGSALAAGRCHGSQLRVQTGLRRPVTHPSAEDRPLPTVTQGYTPPSRSYTSTGPSPRGPRRVPAFDGVPGADRRRVSCGNINRGNGDHDASALAFHPGHTPTGSEPWWPFPGLGGAVACVSLSRGRRYLLTGRRDSQRFGHGPQGLAGRGVALAEEG